MAIVVVASNIPRQFLILTDYNMGCVYSLQVSCH
jgi:hypothetical protein